MSDYIEYLSPMSTNLTVQLSTDRLCTPPPRRFVFDDSGAERFAPHLRRSVALVPRSISDFESKIWLDFGSVSNSDILNMSERLKKGKFRHTRAKQLQFAAKAGCKISPLEAFRPEDWKEDLTLFTLQYCKMFEGNCLNRE